MGYYLYDWMKGTTFAHEGTKISSLTKIIANIIGKFS